MVADLTNGRPIKVLLSFSLPMIAGNIVQQFYNMVDLMVVGRYVGVHALAAVGATTSIMFFVFSMVIGLTNGASVVVSQYFGHGDDQKTRHAISTAVYVLAVAAVLLTALGIGITRPVLQVMNTPPEVIDGAAEYLHVIFIGVVATVAYNGIASVLRALGNSMTPLVFLVISAVSNIFLDLLFVVGLDMGVRGAAWATILAQALSAAACIVYAVRGTPILRLRKADFVIERNILSQTIKLGVPSGIQQSLLSVGAMAVQSAVNSFGPHVVAAYAGATKLDQLAIQPLLSLSMADATFTAQNMGAGRADRARKGFWSGVTLAAIFCAVLTPVLFVFGGRLMTLFVSSAETEVLAVGAQYLRIVPLFYLLVGVILLLENFLRGAGDVLVPMCSNALEIVVRIAAAYTLSGVIGPLGIWLAGPLSWLAGTVICATRYCSGKWQSKVLIVGEAAADSTNETGS